MPDVTRFEELFDTEELADLGPGPRPGVLSADQLEKQLGPALAGSGLPGQQQDLLRALVLLWHDHLEAAHVIAQNIPTADGSFVHGIMHRREPDFGNAAYWFRRVGSHPAFRLMPARAEPLLGRSKGTFTWTAALIRNGSWDPFAFIDACQAAGAKPGAEQTLLRQLQKEEFKVLLECFQKK
ncbi:MAG TPA: hypothetical protein VKY92_07950 [Verrucomicrobiae bacterium]|nr:hypothetical protein [Verrucomicrobiae bacterium]